MTTLQYPFDSDYILKKRKAIKRELLSNVNAAFTDVKIAVLGGSTTYDIVSILELFLLDYGIRPEFYQSEYGMYWHDAMFDNEALDNFKPDVIYIHTSNRNVIHYPDIQDNADSIEELLKSQYEHFEAMWSNLDRKYNCPIIQNNFEMPIFRILGNKDVSDIHGRINFLNRLNSQLYDYANTHSNFYINDINYLSASYGLEKYSEPTNWYMYKYCLSVEAIPAFSFNLANIVKSLYGKNKKALVLDLDNTLWGGVVGDDGIEGIEIGNETQMGQVYLEFQSYIKAHKNLGIVLCVNSKNEHEAAIAGLEHPEGALRSKDFICIKANWNSKDKNIREIAQELNIGLDSIVFIDDNPAERDIVMTQVPDVAVPHINKVEDFIRVIDRSGFFEITSLSADDLMRSEMYERNRQRNDHSNAFENYQDYLISLKMTAVIKEFESLYIQRITQLTNKSNQFNLTTKRYTQSEMEAIAIDSTFIKLYGKLVDKFGDNGIVSVVIGKKEGKVLHIDLWLMSCRVLKRDFEYAMLDRLVEVANRNSVEVIKGYYYQTAKNGMVKDFYAMMGFAKIEQNDNDSVWELVTKDYVNRNNVISME